MIVHLKKYHQLYIFTVAAFFVNWLVFSFALSSDKPSITKLLACFMVAFPSVILFLYFLKLSRVTEGKDGE